MTHAENLKYLALGGREERGLYQISTAYKDTTQIQQKLSIA